GSPLRQVARPRLLELVPVIAPDGFGADAYRSRYDAETVKHSGELVLGDRLPGFAELGPRSPLHTRKCLGQHLGEHPVSPIACTGIECGPDVGQQHRLGRVAVPWSQGHRSLADKLRPVGTDDIGNGVEW